MLTEQEKAAGLIGFNFALRIKSTLSFKPKEEENKFFHTVGLFFQVKVPSCLTVNANFLSIS